MEKLDPPGISNRRVRRFYVDVTAERLAAASRADLAARSGAAPFRDCPELAQEPLLALALPPLVQAPLRVQRSSR
jgi:hypothetical protein